LSRELTICATTFGLSASDLVALTVNAVQYTFASDLERQLIHEAIRQFGAMSVEQH